MRHHQRRRAHARLELLEAEKELTRRSHELARRRQELPWVRMRPVLEADSGPVATQAASCDITPVQYLQELHG